MAQTQPQDVPLARGGAVTDEILETMIGLCDDLNDNQLSPEGALLLLQNMPGVLAELKHRRRIQSLIHQASHPDNVIFLPNG